MPGIPFRLLRVDLTSGSHEISLEDQADVRGFIGGASLAARLLEPLLTRALDPLAPEAPLLFLTGPLTGTTGPSVGRAVFAGKSPATGLWAESNIGGYLGAELRAAGFDGLVVTGRSPDPAYLWIHDGGVELRPAGHLWGVSDTTATQNQIRAELGDRLVRVGCIGLGGESGLPFASILCDHGRVAGRTGLGAVLGAKRLKAIAVRGRQPIPLAFPDAFHRLRRETNLELREDNLSRAARAAGTASGLDYWHYLGTMPVHYYTRGRLESAEQVSGNTIAETIQVGVSTCQGCVIACGRVIAFDEGRRRKGPEYETIVGFGPSLGITDIRAVSRLSELCDAYGLDTISLSNTIGLAFLLFERGLVTESDTDGHRLTWGNAPAVERLIHQTVRREGFGGLIALGARALAQHFGVPETAAQVKGLEMAYHDPRGLSGMALVYATSARGACHNQGDYYVVDSLRRNDEELDIQAFDRHAGAEKVESVVRNQDWTAARNSLVLCIFANVAASRIVELLNQATGLDFTVQGLLESGERATNLKRLINCRLGLKGEDDRLPGHFLTPLRDGGSAGHVPQIEEMLEAYYRVRGWDPRTGHPLVDTLRRLGLDAANRPTA